MHALLFGLIAPARRNCAGPPRTLQSMRAVNRPTENVIIRAAASGDRRAPTAPTPDVLDGDTGRATMGLPSSHRPGHRPVLPAEA